VCKDEADPARRLLLPLKSNISPDVGGLAFSIMPHGLDGQATLCWAAEPVSVDADDAIGHGQRGKRGPAPDERTEAADWLREQLTDGPRPAKAIMVDGSDIGFSKRTLYRAFKEINGVSTLNGFPARAEWSLPSCNSVARLSKPGIPGTTGTTEETHLKQQQTYKFLSNGSAVVPSSESVDQLDDLAMFEAERAAIQAEGDEDTRW
jgi:hypothetical protein